MEKKESNNNINKNKNNINENENENKKNKINKIKRNQNIGIYIHIPFCKKKCYYCDFISFTDNYLESNFSILSPNKKKFKIINEKNKENKDFKNNIKNINDEIDFKSIYTKALVNQILYENFDFLEDNFDKINEDEDKDENGLKNENNFKINLLDKKYLKNKINIDTIFIGGGTPSFIEADLIGDILNAVRKRFNVLEDAEITIECNPDSLTEGKLLKYKDYGITRVSMGLQTSNNKLLNNIGRTHTVEKFLDIYPIAKKYFKVNFDLIFGLPDQTLNDIEKDLKLVEKLSPNSFSYYSLILEEGTLFYINQDKLNFPDEETERKMQNLIYKKSEEIGYPRYEISNFATKNNFSKHNINTWNQREYLGFGLNAASYFLGNRFSVTRNFDHFINYYCDENILIKNNININQNINKKNIFKVTEVQDLQTMKKEHLLLGFRLKEYDSKKYFEKFNSRLEIDFENELKDLKNKNLIKLIKRNDDFYTLSLTKKGLDFANIVWTYFI